MRPIPPPALLLAAALALPAGSRCQPARPVTVAVTLRGVATANLALAPAAGPGANTPLGAARDVGPGERRTFQVDARLLPADLTLYVEYHEAGAGGGRTAAVEIYAAGQGDIELRLNPAHASQPDSVDFGPADAENAANQRFRAQEQRWAEQLALLQLVVERYDPPGGSHGAFRQSAIAEHRAATDSHNAWVRGEMQRHRGLMSARTFALELRPHRDWAQPRAERERRYRAQAAENIDFADTLLARTARYRRFLDDYMSAQLDPADPQGNKERLAQAGQALLRLAENGAPAVRGQLADYLYEGYEAMDAGPGIAMLARHLADADAAQWPARRRGEIELRAAGLQKLAPGAPAPDITLTDADGAELTLSGFGGQKPFKLLLFWSADCDHCRATTEQLAALQRQPHAAGKFDVLAVSVDATDVEVAAWRRRRRDFPQWRHALAPGGTLSPQAQAYCVTSAPMMYLVRSRDNAIAAAPATVAELEAYFR